MNSNSPHKDREAIQTLKMHMWDIRQTLLITNVNQAIPCAMSGFKTVLLTLAALCIFLYRDQETIQMPKNSS